MLIKHGDISRIARMNGIRPGTAHSRIERGWSPEEALTTPKNPIFHHGALTKNEAELWLNDVSMDKFPECLKKFLGKRAKKNGARIRSEFRSEFDKWFESLNGKLPS